jgi:hypothetical protein
MPRRTITHARVIPWDEVWGVYVRYSDGYNTAYPVGSQDRADDELRRIGGGSPAPVPVLEPTG